MQSKEKGLAHWIAEMPKHVKALSAIRGSKTHRPADSASGEPP